MKSLILDTIMVMGFVSLVVALVVATLFNSEVARLKREIAQLEVKLSKGRGRIPGYPKEMQQFLFKARSVEAEKREAIEANRRLKLFVIGNKEAAKLPIGDYGKQLAQASVGFGKYLSHPISYLDFVSLYSDLISEIYVRRWEKQLAKNEVEGVRRFLEGRKNLYQEVRKEKENFISKLDRENGDIRDENSRKIGALSDERTDLEDELEKTHKAIEGLRNYYEGVRIQRMENLISNRLQKIQRLKEKIRRRRTVEDLLPDGEVVVSHHTLGYVWISLGRIHGLQKGTVFRVFQYTKGGERNFKGKIEVVRVDVELSQARVLEEYYRDSPIVRGDYVFSPFFDRKRPLNIVFAGEGPSSKLYRLSQYKRWVEQIGQNVQMKVNHRTDFLVLLKGYDMSKAYEDARNFPWIIFVTEKEFLEYLKRK